MTQNNTLKTLVETVVDTILTEVEFASQTQAPLSVLVDSDGVMADFDGAVGQDPMVQKTREEFRKVIANFPDFANLTDDDLKKRLAGPQPDPGMRALKKAWQEYRNHKFRVAGNTGFFLNLPILPGAREMLSKIAELTGKRPSILTAPIETNKEQCEEEKRAWFEKNMAGLYDQFICDSNKFKYANPNTLLIDDRSKYTVPFENAGGMVILHKNPQDTLAKLEQVILARQNRQV